MKDAFTIGVFALILDDKDRVLLSQRRDNGLWNLPGGTLEIGETIDQCLVREVKEETGLKVDVISPVGIYSKKRVNDLVMVFECEIIGGKLKVTEESKKHGWFKRGKFPLKTIPRHAARIKDFFKNRDKLYIKFSRAPSASYLLKQLKSKK